MEYIFLFQYKKIRFLLGGVVPNWYNEIFLLTEVYKKKGKDKLSSPFFLSLYITKLYYSSISIILKGIFNIDW
jgi:hypothetical protein